MHLSLSPETQKLLERQMKKGGYQSPEDAVRAGLAYLDQRASAGGFEAGEWDKLLAVADAEIERGDVIDGDEALRARQARRAPRAKKST
jgi:Arc/MetJ-type ribon-helix-helix transcriptional regulator